MTKTTEIIAVATEQPEAEAPKKPLFPFFPNFNFNFNLQQLPFPFFQPQKHKDDKATIPKQQHEGVGEGEGSTPSKRGFVFFPNTQVVVPPPLEAVPDADYSNAKTSNPLILWQVYAIAGVIVSKWIWARWNERKARGRSPDDDRDEGRHSGDGRRSPDNE